MKAGVIAAIIIGSSLFIAGGAVFAIGVSKGFPIDESKTINETVLTDEFINFNIELATSDLEFKLSTDGTKKVVCLETEKNYHEVKVIDNTLVIKQVDTRQWYEKIFDFTSNFGLKATVYLPEGAFDEFKFSGSTGGVYIPNDYSFNKFDATLSTGSISLEADVVNETKIIVSTGSICVKEMNTTNLNLKGTTGSVSVKDTNVSNNITIETSSGHIELENVKGKNYTSNCSVGHTELKNVLIDDHIEIETSTGHVKLEDSDCDTAKIKTTTGSVNGTFLTDKIVHASTKTGHVDVPHLTTGGLVEIETTTGSITIKIKE